MNRLITPFECGCGVVTEFLPANTKKGDPALDQYPGLWWDCPDCKSSHYSAPEKVDPIEYCDCDDCADRERPCALDCGDEDPCRGCREARQEAEETAWEIDQAQGRR